MIKKNEIKSVCSFFDYIQRLDNKIAVIYNNKNYTYADIYQMSLYFSQWLITNNINNVMTTMKNSVFSICLLYSCWLTNTKCFNINPRFISYEIHKIINHSYDINLLIINEFQYSFSLENFCSKNKIKFLILEQHSNFFFGKKSLINKSFIKDIFKICSSNKSVIYHASSGTTGKYSFYGHDFYQIINYLYNMKNNYGLLKNDISLISLSLNHAYAFSYQLLPSISLGNIIVIMESFDPVKCLQYINQYNITALALTPIMYYKLYKQYENVDYKIKSLRHLSVAGDQATNSLFVKIKKTFNLPLLNGIGMTELYGYAQNLTESNENNKIKILKHCKIKIKCIKKLNDLKKNYIKIGEIYVDSITKPFSFKKKWFPTGDIGYVVKNNIYFLGRVKDIIIKGGSNISPLELEYYLNKINNIKESVVVGKKDNIWGEILFACVILNKNEKILTLENINYYLKKYVAKYKLIDKIMYLDNFIFNKNEKIDRIKMKKYINNIL